MKVILSEKSKIPQKECPHPYFQNKYELIETYCQHQYLKPRME